MRSVSAVKSKMVSLPLSGLKTKVSEPALAVIGSSPGPALIWSLPGPPDGVSLVIKYRGRAYPYTASGRVSYITYRMLGLRIQVETVTRAQVEHFVIYLCTKSSTQDVDKLFSLISAYCRYGTVGWYFNQEHSQFFIFYRAVEPVIDNGRSHINTNRSVGPPDQRARFGRGNEITDIDFKGLGEFKD